MYFSKSFYNSMHYFYCFVIFNANPFCCIFGVFNGLSVSSSPSSTLFLLVCLFDILNSSFFFYFAMIFVKKVLKSTENLGLESNLARTKHGQSGAVRSHVSDPAHGRRAPNLGQPLNVTTYNVRTMADTTRQTD